MITQYDLAWMAGVIDLKGRLTFKNNRTRATRQITLNVDSKEHLVVRRLCAMTGTKPEYRNTSPVSEYLRRSCLEHCPEPHVHNDGGFSHGSIRWTTTGTSMVTVLQNLEPYITVDRGYAEAMDEVMRGATLESRGAQAVISRLFHLYDLGWQLHEPMLGAVQDRLTELEQKQLEAGPDSSTDRAASS